MTKGELNKENFVFLLYSKNIAIWGTLNLTPEAFYYFLKSFSVVGIFCQPF